MPLCICCFQKMTDISMVLQNRLVFTVLLLLLSFGLVVVVSSSTSGVYSSYYDATMMIHRSAYPSKRGGNLMNNRSGRSCSSSSSTIQYEYDSVSTCDDDLQQAACTQPPEVEMVGAMPKVAQNLIRGAVLRIASDLTGGTPLESIKTRVTVTTEGPWEAMQSIVSGADGGIRALWAGTPARTVEGALQGALFVAGSVGTKKMILANGGSSTMAALGGGFVGGIVQSLIMTPAGMVFTSLNVNKSAPGYENDTALSVTRRLLKQKGIPGLYAGIAPMAFRQSTNWASRAGLTELVRTQLRMSQYGLLGEIGSGVIGGLGSCWNTPVETVRLLMQRDVGRGKQAKSFAAYVDQIVERDGVSGLFRGVTPRGIQAIWQTAFMVVVPNLLGV